MAVDHVVALVVTYNRKVLLTECLEAILSQTFPVTELIVIDNASTDGTQEHLKEKGILDNPCVKYVRMDTNTGGSGGFYEGLRLSREGTCDWVWLMDDDTIPTANCLEGLIKAKELLYQQGEKISFLASSIYGAEGEFMNVPIVSKKLSENGYGYWYKYLERGLINIDTATFVSLLINADAIAECGLPCKDFFIWGDDTEYTTRITTYYGDAYLVGNSVAIHKRKNAKALNLAYETEKSRIDMYHYLYRNNYIVGIYYKRTKRLAKLKAFKSNFICALRFIKQDKGWHKFWIVLKGTWEGVMQYKRFRIFIDDQLKR